MNTSTTSTESKTDSQTTMPVPPTTSGYTKPDETEAKPEIETKDDNLDELGYEKTDEQKATDKEQPVEEKKDDEDVIVTKATGYGEEETDEKKPVENKVETPEEEKTDEQKTAETLEKELDDSLGKLPEGFDKAPIKKFATDNKMTKEQVDNYVKFVQDDSDRMTKENNQAVIDQRNAWTEELKNDPEFGGENFTKSIDTAEKILDKYMPNLKKVLTERGTMVPPYIMKDFLKLSQTLNPTSGLDEGDAPIVPEKEVNYLDAMYE